jgi:hypothetical protein
MFKHLSIQSDADLFLWLGHNGGAPLRRRASSLKSALSRGLPFERK